MEVRKEDKAAYYIHCNDRGIQEEFIDHSKIHVYIQVNLLMKSIFINMKV